MAGKEGNDHTSEPLVIAEDLAKRFGDFIALHPLNVRVHAGEFFGVFGPNGAGKSTFIKLLTGQLKPSLGRVEVLGIDAETESQRLKANIGIVPESGPNRVGLVGLPVWMWVDSPTDDTFGPITASASEGPVWVSATASVSSIVWNMGDGTKVTCTGKGTPYADHYGKQDSPTCGHRYAKMSTDQPEGAYQVTAASHWVVEWTGGGQSGTIEFDLATEPLPIRIGEAQVLTQ